jgi:bifunctional non-homologous end joining protein LigD
MANLEPYSRKRRFDHTPEPSPRKRAKQHDQTFVVQKHAAGRLHYDFRLAIDGVLKSWAVPKGPSLNPSDKRLAVETEEHPIDYANFEGIIPKGNYGAGTVMVWDRGVFCVEGDLLASRQWERGEIKFNLQGEKLRGSFVLVKTRSEKGNEWLMIKHQDEAADSGWNIDEHDGSVLTGRTLEEIAEGLSPKREATPIEPAELHGARKGRAPTGISPMLATPIDRPFSDPGWLFEIKWDGARTLAYVAEGRVLLKSRAGNDVTAQYPELASLPQSLCASHAVLDGEIVVLDDQGRSVFESMQQRMNVRSPSAQLISQFPVTYYIFDLLYCNGYDLRAAPLFERKELLCRLLRPAPGVRFSDHQVGRGKELYELAREENLEGIIGKRADSPYASLRSKNWVKVKATKSLDAVVGGWTAPRGGRSHFGALLLGLYQGEKLRFIGHVGTGLDEQVRKTVAKQLREREITACPFDHVPETNEKAFWAKPEIVARVRFMSWTPEPRLRAPVFVGLRRDVQPADCRWEGEVEAEPAPALVQAPGTAGQVFAERSRIEAELFEGREETITIDLDGKRFRLTNLNKVYFPESGVTKRELIAYYYRVADHILPFLKDRPLVLRRYPDGIRGQAFFQKDIREGSPRWLETVSVPSEGKRGEVRYAIASDLASLLYLTGLGCIDHNPWSSRIDDLEHPDYFFFDLDPAEGTTFSAVVKIARAIYEKLTELGLKVYLKTSGATGFHLYLPVERIYTYEQLRMLGEIVAQLVSEQNPGLVTHERIVTKRRAGQVLIDITQNAFGRPLAAPYSVRAFPQAPVSAPVTPDELRSSLHQEKLNLRTIFARLKDKGDLWADFWNSSQRIEQAIGQLSSKVLNREKR